MKKTLLDAIRVILFPPPVQCMMAYNGKWPSVVHYFSRCIVGYFESTIWGIINLTLHSRSTTKWQTHYIVHYVMGSLRHRTQPKNRCAFVTDGWDFYTYRVSGSSSYRVLHVAARFSLEWTHQTAFAFLCHCRGGWEEQRWVGCYLHLHHKVTRNPPHWYVENNVKQTMLCRQWDQKYI